MTYTISRDTNVVSVIAAGVVTLQDCVRSVDGLLGEGMVRPGMQLLVDATSLKPKLSCDDLRDLAAHVRRLAPRGLDSIAIIAASDFVFGLARAFSTYAGIQGVNVATFRTQKTASVWLQSCKLVAYSPAQSSSIMTGEPQ